MFDPERPCNSNNCNYEDKVGSNPDRAFITYTSTTPFQSTKLGDLWHSVVKFVEVNDANRWIHHRNYIDEYKKKTADGSWEEINRITRLPPPLRQCKVCEAGKSMLQSSPEEANGECRRLINEALTGLTGVVTTCPSFQECLISWLDPNGACFEFPGGYTCKNCPVGTYQVDPQDIGDYDNGR
jgi:hypothetical protein